MNATTFEDHAAHAQALAKLLTLVATLAAEHQTTTSVREFAGPLAFVAELLDDTITRALHAEVTDDNADRCPACGEVTR